MDPLSFAVDAIFEDALLAEGGTWHPAGGADGTAVRVLRRAPDRIEDWNGARIVVDSVLLEIRVADAPTLGAGDLVVIGDETLEVMAEPRRSPDRTVWQVEARAR
jgi:hypothetical protein